MPKNKKDKVSGVQMGINNPDPNSLPSSLFLISLRTKFTLILYIKTILRATYFIKKFQIFRSITDPARSTGSQAPDVQKTSCAASCLQFCRAPFLPITLARSFDLHDLREPVSQYIVSGHADDPRPIH